METKVNFKRKDDFILETTAIINAYTLIKNTWQTILDLLCKENGKTFNRRFISKLEKLIDTTKVRVSLIDVFMGCNLDIFVINRYYQDTHNQIQYFDKKLYYCSLDKKNFIDDEGKIDFNKAEQAISAIIAHISKKIAEYKDAVQNFDTYTNKVNAALESLKNAMRGVNEFFVPVSINRYDFWESKDINNS